MKLTLSEQQEKDVQEEIFRCIDKYTSFCFNAGAGAGKTYALVQAIKYILQKNIKKIKRNNQQIICITYTNVAVEEIKERLGLSDTVLVSTIHERLWALIKLYQKELIDLHRENLIENISKIDSEIADTTNSQYPRFANLKEEQKQNFIKFSLDNKEFFYQKVNLSASELRSVYESRDDTPDFLPDMLSNIGNFKKITKSIYKKDRYQQCLERIDRGAEKKIDYDNSSNSDRLEYMKFSHDTLLEYAYKLIDKYPTLQRILVDKYPYFFIDEYQDTHENVIKIIKKLSDFSKKNKKLWLVGYFGDTAQNIYDDGIGSRIENIHDNLEVIDKEFNRRSHSQIINVINKIRNDNIKQRTLFDDRNSGSVKFFESVCNNTEKLKKTLSFLNDYKHSLQKTSSGETIKIHCLVLTNKLLAQLSNFGEIYDVIYSADDIYWNEIKTKFLSHELEKLHPTILLIYYLVMLQKKLNDDKTTYHDLLGILNKDISFKDIHKLVTSLKKIDATDLKDFIKNLSNTLNSADINQSLKAFLFKNISIDLRDVKSSGSLENYIMIKLHELMYKDTSENGNSSDENLLEIQELLKIDLSQWELWADFINRKENQDIVFHTYHGTKGEEYENVAIIMEHGFGRDADKFKDFFKIIQNTTSSTPNENTKNLVYVACSRAIRNLRILYLDDTTEIAQGVKSLFSDIEKYNDNT